jgi:hypothetical protein
MDLRDIASSHTMRTNRTVENDRMSLPVREDASDRSGSTDPSGAWRRRGRFRNALSHRVQRIRIDHDSVDPSTSMRPLWCPAGIERMPGQMVSTWV